MNRNNVASLVVTLLAMLLLAACGSRGTTQTTNQDGSSSDSRASSSVPTMPSANFAQPTTMIGAAQGITATQSETATVASVSVTVTSAAATPEVDLSRGARIFEMRNCGDCHGAMAEGVAGKGAALAGTTLTYAEVEDAVRTAKSGKLGSGHVYGPSAVSPSGLQAIYDWFVSLP